MRNCSAAERNCLAAEWNCLAANRNCLAFEWNCLADEWNCAAAEWNCLATVLRGTKLSDIYDFSHGSAHMGNWQSELLSYMLSMSTDLSSQYSHLAVLIELIFQYVL